MAELLTLARPYAKAAFEYGRSANDLSGWLKALGEAALVSQDAGMQKVLDAPNLTRKEKGDCFNEVCGDLLNSNQKNFVSILADNNRLDLLPQISSLFELYKANQERTVDVDIQTAFEIVPELEAKLAKILAEKLDRKVTLKTSVDRSLLGGALVRAGDTVIDGSARGHLARLADAINT